MEGKKGREKEEKRSAKQGFMWGDLYISFLGVWWGFVWGFIFTFQLVNHK